MIKKKLKRLLEYCPKPPEPLTTTLKRYSIPITIIVSVSIALTSFFLFYFSPAQSTILPPLTMITKYNPGVKVGDYVTYGNFVCNLEHREKDVICINELAFRKMEVIAVSGKEVTFLHTEQLKNGSQTWKTGCTETLDVEDAWWSDDSENYIDYDLVIAANLTEGDLIHLYVSNFPGDKIIKTEVRTYLGSSRKVNLRRYPPQMKDGLNVTINEVYDQESGIRLEAMLITSDGDVKWAMSVIETNIFSSSTSSPISSLQENTAESIPTEAFYTTTGLVVFVVSLVAGVIFGKKRLGGGENDYE